MKTQTEHLPTPGDSPSIYRDYFQLTDEYIAKYGPRTIVLMQVGAFFEVYGLKPPGAESILVDRSRIVEFAQIGNLSISEKKITFEGAGVVMAGFRDYTLEKYLPKLTSAGMNAVVYVQEGQGKQIRRVLDAVYSPGTYVSHDTESSPQMTNHIMCIWMETHTPRIQKTTSPVAEKTRETIIYGVAVANIFTGKTAMFEHQAPFYLSPTTFDELERYVSVYSPSEIIFLSPFSDAQADRILHFSGVQTTHLHRIDSRNPPNDSVVNCTKQKYVRHIFATFYGEDAYDVCAEIQTYTIATQAFCYLMHFIQEHNPNLVRNIEMPVFTNTSSRMVLANHTLKQLNIIDGDESRGRGPHSSVAHFLNQCSTPMGRRQFFSQITNPRVDVEWLQREYEVIADLLTPEKNAWVDPLRKTLRELVDMEKLMRQLLVRKIYPGSMYKWWTSIRTLETIHSLFSAHPDWTDYLVSETEPIPGTTAESSYAFVADVAQTIRLLMERYLSMETCAGVQSYDVMFIRPGISAVLDEMNRQTAMNIAMFSEIREALNALVRAEDGGGTANPSKEIEYIRVHDTEKSGSTLQITKKRALLLRKLLARNPDQLVSLPISGKTFRLREITFVSASSSNDEIVLPLLTTLCRELLTSKQRLSEIVEKVYVEFLQELETTGYRLLEILCRYIAKLDLALTKTYLAKTYHYCRPEIDAKSSHSYVRATGLRHCLIEHIQQNELYVTNDVELGGDTETRGMLLYGTNAVGKTSLIRAMGIAVILAQSGMYVPCSRMVYRPYTAMFTRILGNDNLFRGLSTFAVEMSELRMILKLADADSLVLGDELCSGTETESALSIFMAGLADLHAKRASFLFATHFHEILKMDELRALSGVAIAHLSVHYNRELDCLVYDRKLAKGPGKRMYGLEVCKSLHLPAEFLEKAYEIRKKYFPETKGELSQPVASNYNSHKIRGVCEMCHAEVGEETHHLQEQRYANIDGYIDDFHKNHPANLMSLCSKCHQVIHSAQYSPECRGDEPVAVSMHLSPAISTPPRSDPSPVVRKKMVRKKTTKGYAVFREDDPAR